MKKLLLIALAAFVPFSMVFAQMPDPANFHVYYGNNDGSEITVGIDKDISLPIWVSTDPTPGNPDTVNFVHMPLMSDDNVISARTGGTKIGKLLGWQDASFRPVNNNGNDPVVPVGFQSQSLLGFAYVGVGDPNPDVWIYTLGAKELIGYFNMHTKNDPALVPQHLIPFSEGHNPANLYTLWGMAGGVRNVVPTLHFGGLYFSPNQPPVWTTADNTTITGIHPVTYTVTGTDPDLGNTLTISENSVVLATATGGSISFTGTDNIIGTTVHHFVLSDGQVDVPLTLTTVGLCNPYPLTMTMPCPVEAAPGQLGVPVSISLDNRNECDVLPVGGVEILIAWDPTALTITGATPTARLNNGLEYFNWVHEPIGPGSARFVWIADTPESGTMPPCQPGDGAIINLTFNIASGLLISDSASIYFTTDGPGDYTSNTISDSTGNLWLHPGLGNGCIHIADPSTFEGDPNMNCAEFEVGDAVLVAQRLIYGYSVWGGDTEVIPGCSLRNPADPHANDALQEAAGDLNGNGHPDIADLVRFINILNGFIFPKVDPVAGQASFFMNDGAVRINSNVEVGGVLVRINHTGEIGTPIANNGMTILANDANGVLSVLVYSMEGKRIPSGNQSLFTLTGEGTISEASASDAYGYLLESRTGAPIPTEFGVSQNYPNPFNAKTLINFALPTASDVTVNIYSITGQVVETLKGTFEAGNQSMTWDASQVASGVYFAKVLAGSNSQTLKMTLLK
jgi:hypothetical protein